MLLSRRNQLLLEFSFWNEPQPRQGPNIYELRTYKLKVGISLCLKGGGVQADIAQVLGGGPPNSSLLDDETPSRARRGVSECFSCPVSSQAP